ncbi:MAG: DNA-directed RNA polymerase subunit beta' [Coriobacteriia bacterium]|nr:DNA-directed RNA polymerase subunit beta' [Coriobacteriia bacterium]
MSNNIDVSNFDRLRIRLVSADDMRRWSYGEVKKAETINYRSQKPERDGLFCERIFGPSKDWECSCGKYRRIRYKGITCERCGVEVTRAKVRRERMGHIELAAPVSHVWYAQGVAKHMSTLLDIKYKDLERVLYFVSPIITSVDNEAREADLPELREELTADLEEFKRTRERELTEAIFERDMAIALAVADLDDAEIAIALSKSAESRALKNAVKAVDKGTEGAQEKLDALLATYGLEANYPTAHEMLLKLRSGEIEPDEDYLKYEGQALGDRLRNILKDANNDLAEIEEDYEERCQIRTEAFNQFTKIVPRQIFDDEIVYREMARLYGPQIASDGQVRDSGYFTGGMGAENVRDLLGAIDLSVLQKDLRAALAKAHEAGTPTSSQLVKKLVKRLSVVDAFAHSGIDPRWMILDVIPVMPPELRPMVQLDGGRFATSDLNDLYRRVINRNNRLKKLLDLGAPDIIINNEKRMLQEAVDKLFDNRRDDRRQVKGPSGRALKSLSHTLNGKQGRFRQNLLGKRVDYSGRSVIVGGPELKLHQCGLPKYMALELFKPFVMKRLVDRYAETDGREGAPNVKAAKKFVERQRAIVWDVLEEVIEDHPVLLNRAPTLHRLGIQAFAPVLVEGKAIRLHPLVCTAFNADFDGDQMAVHVPLSAEAQAESRVLMLSTNNIKSPANGKALATPSQDMVLGLYYLTTLREPEQDKHTSVFMNEDEALLAHDAGEVSLQSPIEVRATRPIDLRDDANDKESRLVEKGTRFTTTVGRLIFNQSLPVDFPFINYTLNKNKIADIVEDLADAYSTTDMGIILDEIKRLGFYYVTMAGITVSLYDATTPQNKKEILFKYEEEARAIEDAYEAGTMDSDERHKLVIDVWNRATDEVGAAMVESFDIQNPIYQMADSGARGNLKQFRQLGGMRGLMQSPKGDVIEEPVKSNFREGLTVLEYFISTHGARKGLADTALGTETGGYTTRRFLDFVHDAIVRTEDCGTHEGVMTTIRARHNNELDKNLIGRVVASDVKDKKGNVLLEAGEYVVDLEQLAAFEKAGLDKIDIRTALTCLEGRGICQKCYGYDLSNGKPVDVGTAVGVIAAQSIGEPGTQLTMRTFHTGGVAGTDITQGLPLVNEILESPKANRVFAVLAPQAGKVSLTKEGDKPVITITGAKNKKWSSKPLGPEHILDVVDGDIVVAGQSLTKGRPYGPDMLEIVGREKMLRWIIHELQSVYRGQGVELNDKHFEIIASRMLSKVKVIESGDSLFLVDSYVDRTQFLEANDKIIAEGGKPAEAVDTLIGPLQIVRASMRSLGSESFLSLASFMWTTTVLSQAAIENREDDLVGLKENVILGKLIPAGTGMKRYRNVGLTYKGARISDEANLEVAPDALRDDLLEIESLLPEEDDWDVEEIMGSLISTDEAPFPYTWDDDEIDVSKYLGVAFDPDEMLGSSAIIGLNENEELLGVPVAEPIESPEELVNTFGTIADTPTLTEDIAAAAIEAESLTDIGVSLRWAKKLAAAGVATVGDLAGKDEDTLLHLPGVGPKAVEEVIEGLASHGLPPLNPTMLK